MSAERTVRVVDRRRALQPARTSIDLGPALVAGGCGRSAGDVRDYAAILLAVLAAGVGLALLCLACGGG